MAKIEIYTKALCPYCIRAKKLLDDKGADYIDIPAAMDREKRKEMRSRRYLSTANILVAAMIFSRWRLLENWNPCSQNNAGCRDTNAFGH
jgi:hypothetical protein